MRLSVEEKVDSHFAWADVVGLPAREVYKSDGRSRVWRVDAPGGPMVVKEFRYWPARQVLGWLLRLHPGQLERSRVKLLGRLGVPVVPIVAWGWRGGRYWLASPERGESLQRMFKEGKFSDPGARRRMLRALGRLAGQLAGQGLYFRDLRTSNIVADEGGELRLIDVGSVRRCRGRRKILAMLDILDRSLQRESLSRSDRLRALCGLVESCPHLGSVRELAAAVAGLGSGAWSW